MKRAFTLIELLVVIAIIAILAAILFPVFGQAKLAAKKTAGMAQAKQIGTAATMYLNDSDDVLFPSSTLDANPSYTALVAAGNSNADTYFGSKAKLRTFFNQLLYNYIKNNDIWKAPTKSGAWVNYDTSGSDVTAENRSYGGQNSYGVNSYVILPDNGLPNGSIEETSNTLVLVDASYFKVLPKNPCNLSTNSALFDVTAGDYPSYWANLGNSFAFSSSGPGDTTNIEKNIQNRYNGQLNVIRADSSAKSLDWKKIAYGGPSTTKTDSMWDPIKSGCNQ